MAGLPPKPEDALTPHPSRGGTSPRAASMRSQAMGDRGREDWRRRSPDPRRYSPPRSEWRRPHRDGDRYLDHPPRSARDWDERERPRPRVGRDRGGGMVDTYVPDSHPPPRRRSPPLPRRRPSRSRSPRRLIHIVHSPSPYRQSPSHYSRTPSPRRRPARSESPRRPPRSRKASSHERYKPRPTRSPSPRSHTRRREPNPVVGETHSEERSLHSKSRAASEVRKEDTEPARSPNEDRNLDAPTELSVMERVLSAAKSAAKRLPTHPPPSGPRRPRTPTGPRVRSPARSRPDSLDDVLLRRDSKGKGKEFSRDCDLITQVPRLDRSESPPRGPRRRARWSTSRSRSESRSLSSRSRNSRSRSRSLHSPSHSPARSHSHHTTSEQANFRAPRKDHGERVGRKLPNIDDLIPPLQPRESRTAAQDADLKRIREHRAKLESEHADIMRAVRRAQHELDLAGMELRSAEERRKAAQRVHERTVKGFLTPVG
ncbi:hypothetical protein JB92DRAFT_2945577 [Gautieria morchelliformis]|nr:hypothetical protein JB92DRAFT_2945577 [Gautieria morchelliformis]